MLSCCAGWNKVKLKVGQKWKKLTVSGGLMSNVMWRLLTVPCRIWKKHMVMARLFPAFTSTKVHAFKSNPMKLQESSLSMCACIAGKKKQRPFPIHRLNVKRWLQKRINGGMINRGHIHKTRLVVNSSHDKTAVEQLSTLPVQQCKKLSSGYGNGS